MNIRSLQSSSRQSPSNRVSGTSMLFRQAEPTRGCEQRLRFFHQVSLQLLNADDDHQAATQLCRLLEQAHQPARIEVLVFSSQPAEWLLLAASGEGEFGLGGKSLGDPSTLDSTQLASAIERKASLSSGQAIEVARLGPRQSSLGALVYQIPPAADRTALAVDAANAAAILGIKLNISQSFRQLTESMQEMAKAEDLQKALFEISELSSGAHELVDFLASVHRIVGRLMYARNFFIALYDEVSESISFPYFVDEKDHTLPLPGDEFPLHEIRNTGTSWVIRNGKPLYGSSREIAKKIGAPDAVGSHSKFWMGVPLFAEERVIGAIVTQTYDDESLYTAADKELLNFVSRHISDALQRKRAREELERQVQERTRELASANADLIQENRERQNAEKLQAALFRIAELTSSSVSLTEFFAAIHNIISELLYAANCYIALVSDDGTELNFAYHVDEMDSNPKARKLSQGLTEYVLRTGRPTLVDPEGFEQLQRAGEVKLQGEASYAESWLGVPLQCAGEIVGVLAVQSYRREYQYTRKDQELLTFVSHHISNALDRKRATDALRAAYDELEQRVIERTRELDHVNERLRHENLHDALTELPNRTLFMERLAQTMSRHAGKEETTFAVLFLDLDRFKIINDSLGHLSGDDLLVQVGRRIRNCLRSDDTIARLGGDEFAVLLEHVHTADEVIKTARRIISNFSTPFDIAGQEVFTSTSIGIALSKPEYSKPEEILRDADAAMYHAKAQGRRSFALFDQSLHTEALSALELENELRRALQSSEIHPHFQPIIELATGRVIGFEALARWQHPQRGLVSPAAFIPVAEETGLIVEVDWHIFDQVCAQLATWRQQVPEAGDLSISVNFSSEHFRHFEFPDRILSILENHAVPTRCINIELTESAMIGNFQTVKEVFTQLREAGLRLSLDDFGTGYSSLSYLHRFPVDFLKIEKSFVQDMEQNRESFAIIQTIRALAASLNISVIAEGIETASQLQALRQMDCQFGQGFLMSRPLPADQAEDWLAHRLWREQDAVES